MKKKLLIIRYKNWRGEEGVRRIVPEKIWFGHSEWHEEEQWFIRAKDTDKNEIRDFALKDILEVSSED